MPILKYAKVLLPTTGIGSVLVCFVGLTLSAIFVVRWEGGANDAMARVPQTVKVESKTAVAKIDVAPVVRQAVVAREKKLSVAAQSASVVVAKIEKPAVLPVVEIKPAAKVAEQNVFLQPIAADQLGFLAAYAGSPAKNVLQEPRLRQLVDVIAPYAPFHFGVDMPLQNALESMFSTSTMPIEIRDGRYVMVTGRRQFNGRSPAGRVFLWVDMRQGIALGGIFFYPSNGEPTPTLTLFSSQVKQDSVAMSDLPAAFVRDLRQWSAASGLPTITTRYFINAESKKFVLAHTENYCSAVDGHAAPEKDVCEVMNAEALEIDRKAGQFLDQTHYATNATMYMVAKSSRVVAP